jgi:excisionase family DNA binding protein
MIMAIKDERGRKMISCRDAAREYGCTMGYIRRMVRDGRLEHEFVGRMYFVNADSLKRLASRASKETGRKKKRAEGFKAG